MAVADLKNMDGVIALGTVNFSSGASKPETSTIEDYRAVFTVNADGRLQATETITVNFAGF